MACIELQLPMVLIIMQLVVLLGLLQTLTHLDQKLIRS